MTQRTDYVVSAPRGDVVATFDALPRAQAHVEDRPWLTVMRRTVTLAPVDRKGRFVKAEREMRV